MCQRSLSSTSSKNSVAVSAIIDVPAGQVTLDASVQNGLEQKGIETITQCIKKCVSASGGIPAIVPVCTHPPVLFVVVLLVLCSENVSVNTRRPSASCCCSCGSRSLLTLTDYSSTTDLHRPKVTIEH